jgi:hypothetical protein
MKKVALLTIGLLMVCNCAFAVPYPFDDLGVVGVEDIEFSKTYGPSTTSFTDYYQFTIDKSDLTTGVAALNVLKRKNISILEFSFFTDQALTNGIDPYEADGTSYFFKDMPASTYYFTVAGKVKGTEGGSYYGMLSATPVPVPAAALLLGAGLLGIVGIRRKQTV